MAKLLTVLLAGVAIYAAAGEGEYEITAPFVLASTQVQVVPQPSGPRQEWPRGQSAVLRQVLAAGGRSSGGRLTFSPPHRPR